MRPALRNLLTGLSLSLLVSALLLAALEGAARLYERRNPPPRRAEYIWDWQKQWEGDFYTLAPDPSGWPPGAEWNGDGVRDRRHAVEKPEDTWRLVVLGDSVTFGDGIEAEDAFPQVLQARFDELGRRVEVFNLALWGWSTRQERLAYTRLARKYRPDQVALAVCLNDIPEMKLNLSRPPALLGALFERAALVRVVVNPRGREIQSVEELFTRGDSAKVREGFELFFREVRALRDEAKRDRAALSLLVLPFRFQLAPEAPAPSAQSRIAAFCAAEGLRCLDLLPALRAEGEAAFLDYDHLSPRGTAAVARAILESGLVPEGPAAPEILRAHLGSRPGKGAALAWLASSSSPAGDDVARTLAAALGAEDGAVRRAAAWALSRAGAAAALPALVSALRDPLEGVRSQAAEALGAAGERARPAVPALLEALRDPRQAPRWAAAGSLHRIGIGPEHAAALARALGSEDPYVWAFAAWTLGEMGPAAGEEAGAALARALREQGGAGRAGAAAALAKLGPAAREAVPALVAELRHDKEARRWRAARTLGRIGPAARDAVPALADTLRDRGASVRAQAARALGRIGEGAAPAIPALVAALEDADPEVRQEAMRALSRIPGR